jgi:hypothetical protein
MGELNKSKLIKPSIHPKIKEGESPMGYLLRLLDVNHYLRVSWIFHKQSQLHCNSNAHLVPELKCNSWTGYKEIDCDYLEQIAKLPDIHLNRHLRYCPLCLKEEGHWLLNWHLQASVVCIKHKVWLVDECSGCNSPLELNKVSFRQCICTQRLDMRNDVQTCPDQVLTMQMYLEGKSFSQHSIVPLLTKDASDMNLEQRSETLLVFSRAQPKPKHEIKQVYKQLSLMVTAKSNMTEVSIALFGGCSGFWTFLQAIHHRGYEWKVTGQSSLQKFYRLFYEKCQGSFFEPYRELLEEFINGNVAKELTQRNSLFKAETISNHPWISLQHASREYGISKRTIRRAISDKVLEAKIELINNNTSVLLYKSDLEHKMFRLSDVINGTEAAVILGVTKKQFNQLRDSDAFQQAISPKLGYCSTWQFSKQEIERYAQSILKKVPVIKADYMCIPEIMRTYGKKFDNLFMMLINAIESGELNAKTFNAKQGIRSLSISKTEIIDWIESKLGDVDFYSVPQLAKLIVINQQFAYELINTGIIESDIDKLTGIHSIREEQLATFKTQYILLSKLSNLLNLSSRLLIEYLRSKAIYPVDKEWSRKLRQKVYLRDEVLNVYWIKEIFK